MQNIHSMSNAGGGGDGGDRRLRQNHHHLTNGPPVLKCPRCDSLNTKFCYYNNYNLSQPRHFCKNCRRYWTKGGVLRNVPVGGGCRKKKRSKPKSGNRNPSSCSGVRKPSNSEDSSSDSSSLTATTTAANTTEKTTTIAPVTVADVSGMDSTNSVTTSFRFHGAINTNTSFDPPLVDNRTTTGNSLLPEIDVLTGLMTSSSEFEVGTGISPFRLHHTSRNVEKSNEEQQWMLTDNTTPYELYGMPKKMTDGGVGTEDWNNCTDEALFDLTGTVDQSYWNRTQWDDGDHDNDIPRQHYDHEFDYLR